MLAEGLARLHSKNEDVPEDVEGWEEFEAEARENEIGIWENGAPENFEDEY
jgi:endonuclease YncB( thermonuclease family)